jgi:hypothetical protein
MSVILVKYAAWLLTTIVVILAVLAWGTDVHWQLAGLSTYLWFPIFGLSAFSIMWSQYVISAVQRWLRLDRRQFQAYYEATGWLVFGAIILHPGLLVWRLWADGFGLPPGSYLNHFVAPQLGWVALLGTVSLLIFLAYELRYWLDRKRWWVLVSWANELAMVAIFYHALRLGNELQLGWFRGVWFFYGVSLLAALASRHVGRFRQPEPQPWGMLMGIGVVSAGVLAMVSAFTAL